MDAGSPIVEIRGLRFAYGKRAVLKGVDLDIPSGKVSAILGSSGSGKTTLLQLICGLLKPPPAPCGCGEEVHALDRAGLPALRRRMGMMFQKGGLFTDLTVFENVAFPIREHTSLPRASSTTSC
jgi:phospholipid/cholesterol/gamma-HCH transport system ATP-binding protein